MKKNICSLLFALCSLLCVLPVAHAAPSNELAQIQSQIKKTEQQNKVIEEKVKSSQRDVEKTKKDLVRAADKVSDLETERGALARRISDLDMRRDKLVASLAINQERIADAAATILFVSAHPNFDSENMREYILTSAVLAAASQKFDAEIQQATAQIEELQKVRADRANQKEKLDKTAQKYAGEKKDLDKL